MANTKSAAKFARTTAKRTASNRAVTSTIKNVTRKFRDTVSTGTKEESVAALKATASRLDKAASSGVIHKNAAARRKSRLAKALAKKTVAAA